jgi:deoxyribodipyrimidine photo-lyase
VRSAATGSTILVWFRRDLRVADQPALHEALAGGARVIPCYIHASAEEAPWAPGAASRWWLHGALESLDARLRALGARLIVRSGSTAREIDALIHETGATAVYWNRLYEPAIVKRDQVLKTDLESRGIDAQSFNSALLREPWTIATKGGTPFRVFTPFWNALAARLDQVPPPAPCPDSLPPVASKLASQELSELALLPARDWTAGMSSAWQPTEAAALAGIERLVEVTVGRYPQSRDLPGQEGTSRLSPYLHFGQISPRQILHALRAAQRTAGAPTAGATDTYLRQVGWREFAHHLLFHFPQTTNEPYQPVFARLPARPDPTALRRWQRGQTGIPIVDAGMRELWRTGWMHNRVRMIVASFLTKNLGLSWREGARWFWDTLVDADLANNTLGWQWSAGCGADAAPYYRVFNPVAQAERFDPDGRYLRRWVPEIAALPDRWLPRPWQAPPDELTRARIVIGSTYPAPMVDLKASRERALADYHGMRTAASARRG